MDSSNACGEDVRFVRHVVMIFEPTERLGETVVVFDEIDSGSPEQIDLYWHTFGKIDADCANLTGIIRGEQTAVQFALASTAKATVATETYELSSRRRDNVLHLTCGAVGKAYLASVFSRRRSAAKLRLVKGAKEVRVVLGDLCVSFKSTGHHMQLAGVRRGKAAPVGLQR
jgi:hypothetical protein